MNKIHVQYKYKFRVWKCTANPVTFLHEVRGWFKDPSLEDMGRKYWKKRSYIFQGFVTDNPLTEDTTPENPIRRFIIGPQIFQLLKQRLWIQTWKNCQQIILLV